MEIEGASLDRSVVVAESVVVAWCAARVAADFGRGPISLEGFTAVAIGAAVLAVLLAEALLRRDDSPSALP